MPLINAPSLHFSGRVNDKPESVAVSKLNNLVGRLCFFDFCVCQLVDSTHEMLLGDVWRKVIWDAWTPYIPSYIPRADMHKNQLRPSETNRIKKVKPYKALSTL